MKNLSPKTSTFPEWCILIIFSIGIAWLSISTPKLFEDLLTWGNLHINNGVFSKHISSSVFLDEFFRQYIEGNGRLADKLPIIVIAFLPNWLWGILNAIVYAFLNIGIWKVISFSVHHPINNWLKIAVASLLLLLFPWHELMFLISYSSNYLWTVAIATWTIYIYINDRILRSFSKVTFLFLIFLCIIIGWWHEIIAGSLAPGFFLFILLGNKDLRIRRTAIFLCMLIGLFFLTLSPGFSERVSTTTFATGFSKFFWPETRLPAAWLWAPILYMILSIGAFIIYVKKQRKNSLKSLLGLMRDKLTTNSFLIPLLLLSATIGGIILVYITTFVRASALSTVCSIIGIGIIIKQYEINLPKLKIIRIAGKILTLLLAIAALINLTISAFKEQIWSNHFHQIINTYKNSPQNPVYYNLNWENRYVNHPWQMVYRDIYYSPWAAAIITLNTPEACGYPFRIIPTELKDFSTDNADTHSLDGNGKIYFTKDLLIYSLSEEEKENLLTENQHIPHCTLAYLELIYPSGKIKPIYAVGVPFFNCDRTRAYYFLFPYVNERLILTPSTKATNISVRRKKVWESQN